MLTKLALPQNINWANCHYEKYWHLLGLAVFCKNLRLVFVVLLSINGKIPSYFSHSWPKTCFFFNKITCMLALYPNIWHLFRKINSINAKAMSHWHACPPPFGWTVVYSQNLSLIHLQQFRWLDLAKWVDNVPGKVERSSYKVVVILS